MMGIKNNSHSRSFCCWSHLKCRTSIKLTLFHNLLLVVHSIMILIISRYFTVYSGCVLIGQTDTFWTLSPVTHMDTIQTNEHLAQPTNKQTGRPWSVFVSVFHSVTAAEQQQGRQLICKHNRHNSVETFHKPGRIWLQRFWVALALTDCLCHRTS